MINKSGILAAKGLREGMTVLCYYGNGSACGTFSVEEIGEYFVFGTKTNSEGVKMSLRFRESHTNVIRFLDKGMWRIPA